MALLQDNKVLFYLPFASGFAEYVKGLTWTGDNARWTTSGVIGSGVYDYFGGNNAVLWRTRDPNYSGVTGTTSLTAAIWASGVDEYDNWSLGYANSSNELYNGVRLYLYGGTSSPVVGYYRSSSTCSDFSTQPPALTTDKWTLLVFRVQWDGTYASGNVSINGSGWIGLAPKSDASYPTGTDTRVAIKWNNGRTGGGNDNQPVDEIVCWRNADKFTNEELQNLYDLARTYGLPMSSYSLQFPSNRPSASCPLFARGCDAASGCLPLRIRGISGYLLYDDRVSFYHPCESSKVEFTKNLTWDEGPSGYLSYLPVQIGSGAKDASEYQYAGLFSPSGNYRHPAGDANWVMAFWASGCNGERGNLLAGWFGPPGNYVNAQIADLLFTGGSGVRLGIYTHDSVGNGQTFNFPTKYFSRALGVEFLVARLEFYPNSKVSGYLSLNGEDWVSLGEGTVYNPTTNSVYQIGFRHRPTDTVSQSKWLTADELVLWHDVPKFSPTQLDNLYNLGRTYRRSMSEYQDQYADYVPKASGNVPLRMGGMDRCSGSCDLWMQSCGFAASGLDVYISGVGFLSGQITLFIGSPSPSGDLTLYAHGHDSQSGLCNLFEGGCLSASGWVDGLAVGHAAVSGSAPVHGYGHELASGSMPLALYNQQATGTIDLFIRGVLAHHRSLFLKSPPPTGSNTLDLFVYGSPPGITVGFALKGLDLYVCNNGEPAETTLAHPMFLKVPSGTGPVTGSTCRVMFLKGANVARGQLDLIVRGPYEPASGCVGLFTEGLGGVLSDGYTPFGGAWPVFLKTIPGIHAQMALVIEGFDWPSGSCDLSIAGALGGYNTCSLSMGLFIPGVLGFASGATLLFAEGSYAAGISCSGRIALYAHGY